MADNKTYITQARESGNVLISEDVISTIADHAINEVDGVVALSSKRAVEFAERLSKKGWSKGMKITIEDNNTLQVDCNIIIAYGHSVVAVASAVQDAVTTALESTASVKVSSVNVNVCGIAQQ